MRRFLALMLVVVLGLVGAPVGMVGAQEYCYTGIMRFTGSYWFVDLSDFISEIPGLYQSPTSSWGLLNGYRFRIDGPLSPSRAPVVGGAPTAYPRNVWQTDTGFYYTAINTSAPTANSYTICTSLVNPPTPTASPTPPATAEPTATSTAAGIVMVQVPTLVANQTLEELLAPHTAALGVVGATEIGVAIIGVLLLAMGLMFVVPRRR